MAPLPWEQHLPQVVFHHNGANARLVASHGASFATVYVACSCSVCEKRPVTPHRAGGCVHGLGDWAVHVGLKAASLAEVQVVQQDLNEKVPLAVWLQSASLQMGGESLRRRQVNVFHWNGRLVPDKDNAVVKAGPRHLAPTPLPTAYEGLGSWRAATIRGYDSTTCRFEVKYHDEPKRSQAHLWLPLAVLHFARNPPATAAAIRSNPDTPPTAANEPPFDASPFDAPPYVPHDVVPPPSATPPPLPRPLPGLPPLPLLPQCPYGQPQMAQSVPSPPPQQHVVKQSRHDDVVVRVVPLLGSFHSMPLAPASPQASRQGSPKRKHEPTSIDRSLAALAGGGDAAAAASADSPQRLFLGSSGSEPEVKPPAAPQPIDGFTSSLQCMASGDCLAAAAVACGGGGGAGGGSPATPAAAAGAAAATAARGLADSRMGSFVSLSANSDSGSSNSIAACFAAGSDGDVSGGGGGGVGSQGTSAGGGGGGCTTPSSGVMKREETQLAATGSGTVSGDCNNSEWRAVSELHTKGGSWSPVSEPSYNTLRRPAPDFTLCLSGYWFPNCQLPMPPTSSGADAGSETDAVDAATAAVAALRALPSSDSDGAAAAGDVVAAAAAASPTPPPSMSLAPWAAASSSEALDDDLAALYVELCSEEGNADMPAPLRLPAPAAAAPAFAFAAAAATATAATSTTVAPPPQSQPPSMQPGPQPEGGESSSAAAACRTSAAPAFVTLPSTLPPPLSMPLPAVNTEPSSAIHPALRAALLGRQQQLQQQALLLAVAGQQAAAAAQQGLPTCLPPHAPAPAVATPPAAAPSAGSKRRFVPTAEPYGGVLCGLGSSSAAAAAAAAAAPAPGWQSSGTAAALAAMLFDWDDVATGLLCTTGGVGGVGVGAVAADVGSSWEGWVASEPAGCKRRLA